MERFKNFINLSKKYVALGLAVTLTLGMLLPVTAVNAQDVSEITEEIYLYEESSEKFPMISYTEINNFDQYIIFSPMGFVISDEGRANLKAFEIARIEYILAYSNRQINETKNYIEHSDEINWYSSDIEGVTIYELYTNPLTRGNGVNRISFRWFGVRIYISRNTMRVASTGVAIAGIWVTGGKALKVARTLGVSIGLIPRGVWFDAGLTFNGLLNTTVTLSAGWQ